MSDYIIPTMVVGYVLGVLGLYMLLDILNDSNKNDKDLLCVFALLWPIVLPLLGGLAILYAIRGEMIDGRAR